MDTNQNWHKEYGEFLKSSESSVPEDVSKKALHHIKSLLNPSPYFVFAKLSGLHAITGFFSLAICNQFGLNPFGVSHSLADVFMNFGGHGFCMLACGSLFVSSSILISGFLLSIEETKALRRTEFLQSLTLGLVSIGFFMAFGAEVALTFGGLWMLGALVGGFAATELVWKFKTV